MNSIINTVNDLMDSYNLVLKSADSRVANWPLMSSYTPTWLLTGIYLIIVILLPRFMVNKKPVNLGGLLFLYNGLLVVLNLHIFIEIFGASWRLNYSYVCQPMDYSDNPDELRMARALWWFYFSKLIEFLDTIIFILRKKNGQVSVLHVYHHATMFPIWWIGVKWVPGGQSFFGALINSAVHVAMYAYYAISSLGPEYQSLLWWKKHLTKFQMIQFIFGITHSAQSIFFGCDFPVWMHWALATYTSSILLLFLNFYIRSYIARKNPKTKSSLTDGVNSTHRSSTTTPSN